MKFYIAFIGGFVLGCTDTAIFLPPYVHARQLKKPAWAHGFVPITFLWHQKILAHWRGTYEYETLPEEFTREFYSAWIAGEIG